MIFLNMAPITWFLKRQNSVESSTFGSEVCACKVATEMCRGLRYKLRMMGIPLDGPTYMYCDNNSVVCNTTMPESTLKKKSNSIAYCVGGCGNGRDHHYLLRAHRHKCFRPNDQGRTQLAWLRSDFSRQLSQPIPLV